MSEAAPPVTVGKHPCPECGGDLQWHAGKQALACPYCGTVVPWTPTQAADPGAMIEEHDLIMALAAPASGRGWGTERHEVMCQSCRAISVFVEAKVAKRCDFCGSPSIIAHEASSDAITPQSLLPFKVSDGQVRDAIRKWYGTRWFAPNRLKTAALTDTLHGLFVRCADAGLFAIDAADIRPLVINIWLVVKFWYAFEQASHPSQPISEATGRRGVRQVLALLKPYVTATLRPAFIAACARYGEA